ncbi:LmeA family phospholipid-binding protein [Georgenia sp. Z1344]|uniref:LmeA family phospholipid-binding protein n=1 Tax=Georgenia sp. Z1344 TaxID=3416706 RepID=UPI003CEC7F02
MTPTDDDAGHPEPPTASTAPRVSEPPSEVPDLPPVALPVNDTTSGGPVPGDQVVVRGAGAGGHQADGPDSRSAPDSRPAPDAGEADGLDSRPAPDAGEADTAELDAAGRTAAVPLDQATAAGAADRASAGSALPDEPASVPAGSAPTYVDEGGAGAAPDGDGGADGSAAVGADGTDRSRERRPDTDDETPAALAAVQGAAMSVRRWWRRAGSGVVQRWVLSLVIASLVIVVGLLVADRWALMRARAEAEDAFESFTEELENPDVRLDGFPFLPQVVSGRIDRIDFEADRMVLPDVELLDVEGFMTGVGYRQPVEVAHLEASGTVPLELVQEQVAEATFDVPVLGERSFEADIDGNDLVLTTSVLGGDIHVTAEVAPTEDGRGIHLHLDQGTLAGVSTRLSEIPLVGSRLPLDHYVELEGLPEGLILTDTTVVGDGIAVVVEGDDVRF